MIAQQHYVDTIANNLANINTVGFKKNRIQFEDLFYQTLEGAAGSRENAGRSAPLQIGHGTRLVSSSKLHTQGTTQQTGNPLDLTIDGPGLFQVLMPDGTRAYTRDGSFQLDGEGNMVTSRGFLVEPSINIPPDATEVSVGAQGQVLVRVAGEETPSEIGSLTLARFVNAAGLEAIGGNMFRPTASAGDPIEGRPGESGLGMVVQGALEMSNVQIVEEMVSMIVAQRAFEISSKTIQSSDEMLRIANNLR
jgi:flagellar basal-body rod protein FlgG